MSSKGNSMMKSAQNQKTKQAIQKLVQWYSQKQDFYKVYLPIQQIIVKKIFNAAQITLGRLKDFAQYFAQEKQINAATYEKNEKSVIFDESKYQQKTQAANDPKNSKGLKPVGLDLPPWSGNIDRVLIALSRNQKQKQSRLKKVHKALQAIQDSLGKQQAKYKGQLRKSEKQLESTFDKIDQIEKEESKRFAKLLKQSKCDELKDSSFFIGQFKKMQKYIFNELELFASRGKIIVDMIQILLKLEKQVSKKIKDQLITYRNVKQSLFGSDLKGQQDIWGQVSLLQENIQVQRVTYFNKALLKSERIQDLKKIMTKIEAKNNWQIIVAFLSASNNEFSEIIKAGEKMNQLLKIISYRCWPNISLAQGWLIQTYTPTVMYMTYDSIMLIYNKQGECLKKIHTGSSKVGKVQGNTVFLSEKIKGFFSDSIQEYKIRFEQSQRMQQFQLFIQNQIT